MKVVVVGGGIVGLGSAYELARDGHDVTILEARAAGSGASHGNAAKIAIAEATSRVRSRTVLAVLGASVRPGMP